MLEGFAPAPCLPDDCFCEAVRSVGIVQPANTWSNLAFIVAGAWIASRPGGRVLGAAAALIGAASFIFHATLTYVGMWLDLMGMYLFITFLLLSGAALGKRFAPAYAALNAALGAVIWVLPGTRRWLFAGLVLLTLYGETRARRGDPRWLGAAVGCLAAGFLLWSLDYWKVACDPRGLLQGHAVWHVLCAASTALAYPYLKSAGRLEGVSHLNVKTHPFRVGFDV